MRVGGGAEYHHWNGSAFGMISKPSEEIESRGAWHFDIRDDQAWRRIMLTILIRRLPLQVSNGVFAISANINRCDASLPKGTSEEENVVRIVLNPEDQKFVLPQHPTES
jgi:hypothetical protein